MIAPPSPKVIFYRKLVPLKEYHNMMIPIAASVVSQAHLSVEQYFGQ
jgi:hypothetical protein